MADLQILSAESMTEGQPDKLCDLVSDVVLDAVLSKDRFARVAVDAMATPGLILLSGQISTKSYVEIIRLVRETVADVGYNDPANRFDANSIAVLSVIEEQSPEVALAVDKRGAGNQGIAVGYATDEGATIGIDAEYMPLPIWFAHKLARRLTKVRKDNTLDFLRPDGHAQVTLVYKEFVPSRMFNVTVSACHQESTDIEAVREQVKDAVIRPVLDAYPQLHDERMRIRVNPGGPFIRGGPLADIGLSGRKSVSDAYGTACPFGGSAFSGKDPSKTDRSAMYMARYAAKNLVAAGMAKRLELRLVYLFGVEQPISVQVESFGTGAVPDKRIAEVAREAFDFTTAGIIEALNLRAIRYAPSACYGAFGRVEEGFPWENLDMVEALKSAL